MKAALYSALVDAMQRWMDNNCEESFWLDGYVHPEMADDMARAAAAVADATVHVQVFMRREGHIEP